MFFYLSIYYSFYYCYIIVCSFKEFGCGGLNFLVYKNIEQSYQNGNCYLNDDSNTVYLNTLLNFTLYLI